MMNISSNLKEKALLTIEKYNMFKKNDKVLIAVSGGPDSLTLLNVLLSIRLKYNLDLHIFHLDHMMREECSGKDAVIVKDIADKLQIASTILSFDVPSFIKEKHLSKQDGARQVRYKLLEETANKIGSNKIALGHTLDDQVETVMMRLLRGSGLEGLRGIPPVRDRYIRPLIEITREEIKGYCVKNNLEPSLDSSNLSMKYYRNRIRNDLIPYIVKNYNCNFKEIIFNTTQTLTDDYYVLRGLFLDEFDQTAIFNEGAVRIDLKRFNTLSASVKRGVLRESVRLVKNNLKGIEFKHLEMIIQSVGNEDMGFDLPDDINVYREYETIVVARKELIGNFKNKIVLTIPGITKLPDLGIKVIASLKKINESESFDDQTKAYLDADILCFPLIARMRHKGDKFIPLGLNGTKKLQDFLVDKKVPKRKRDRVIIVESNKYIVWVGGLRIDDRFKVTKDTNNVLVLELEKIIN